MLTGSGYQILSNPEVQLDLPHTRETSGSTLVNSDETTSHDHPLTQESCQHINIPSELPVPELSSQSDNDESAWNLLIDMIETRHDNDVTDLRDEHALEVAERDEEIEHLRREQQQANLKHKRTQRQVRGLLKGHAELKAQVDASQGALQQALFASQALQIQRDELQEKYEKSLVHDDASPVPSTQSDNQKTSIECQVHEHKSLEADLLQSHEALRAMSRDFNQWLDAACDNFNEVHDLKRALEQHPEHDIGLQKVVEYKDKMLGDLEATANQLTLDLDKLQKKSSQDMNRANREISRLQARLTRKTSRINQLRSATDGYKQVSEGILSMLQKKAYPNDLIQAMESYFQVATDENRVLTAGAISQEKQIDDLSAKICELEADLFHEKISSDEKDGLCKDIQQDMREKATQVDDLQMRLEMAQGDLERANEAYNRSLAEAEGRFMATTEQLEKVRDVTVSDRARAYVIRKKEETDYARGLHQQVCEANHELRRIAAQQEEQADLHLRQIYINGVRHDNTQARLIDAEKQLVALRNENKRLRNLPYAVHVTKQTKDQEELESAREKIAHLERVIRGEQPKDEGDAHQAAVTAILKLKVVSYELLVLLDHVNKANQAGESGEDYEAVDEHIVQYRKVLDAIPSCDPEEENNDSELAGTEEAAERAASVSEESQQSEVPATEDANGEEEWDGSFF